MAKKPTIILDLIIKILLVAATILLYWFIWTAWSKAAIADTKEEIPIERSEIIRIQGNSLVGLVAPFYPKVQVLATITAYNPTEKQCDDSPEIMASGRRVYEGAVANNCLEFGDLVEIDGKTYEVQDRLNKRYGCERFDILMFSEEEAKNFGKQTKEIVIY